MTTPAQPVAIAAYLADLSSQLAARDAELAAMTARAEAAEKYARHTWTCDARTISDHDATQLAGLPCTCGFSAAMKAQERGE